MIVMIYRYRDTFCGSNICSRGGGKEQQLILKPPYLEAAVSVEINDSWRVWELDIYVGHICGLSMIKEMTQHLMSQDNVYQFIFFSQDYISFFYFLLINI